CLSCFSLARSQPPTQGTLFPYTTLFRSPGLARAVDTGIRRAAVGRAAVGCGVVGGGGRSRQSVAGTPAPTGRRGLTVGHQVSFEIGRAHVCTPVTFRSRMPSSAAQKKYL